MLIGLTRKRYQVTDKPKRKHNSRILFKLKLMLAVFMAWTMFFTLYPMIWLAPPLFVLTPFIYIGLSLLWIPLAWRTIQHVKRDKVIKFLVLTCLISSLMMSGFFLFRFSNGLQCSPTENWEFDYFCSGRCTDLQAFYTYDVNGVMIVSKLYAPTCIYDWIMF